MKCPQCDSEMSVVKEDISFRSDEKEYKKITYNCDKDDVWVVVETPKERFN